jgi:dsRNA-specific ribonuclease
MARDVVRLLNLDQFFPDLDPLLIRLATTPKNVPLPEAALIQQRYNISPEDQNYETLEFIGDRVLYTIVDQKLLDDFQMKLPLSRFSSAPQSYNMTSNRALQTGESSVGSLFSGQ